MWNIMKWEEIIYCNNDVVKMHALALCFKTKMCVIKKIIGCLYILGPFTQEAQ